MNTTDSDRHPGPAHAGPVLDPVLGSLCPVRPTDRPIFEAALACCREAISDMSFAATLAWADPLGLAWTTEHGHLCLFSAADGDLSMMLPPLPIAPAEAPRLPAAVAACFAIMDSVNAGHPERSRIEYVSDECLDRLRGSDTIALSAAPMHGDYVYPRRALVELDGGPLKNKRKLRSKFLRENPGITTADITPADLPECLDLLDRWREHADERHEGEANDRLIGVDVLRLRDRGSTEAYLNNIATLGLESMLVRAAGRLVGFTIGERLTPTMGVVAVEKTDPGCPGAPQFIYSEFCRTRFEGCTEINAGDDWGIATLRATKLSYRPNRMLAKNVLTRGAVVETGGPESSAVNLLTARPAAVLAVGAAAEPSATAITVRPAVPADVHAVLAVESAAFSSPEDRFTIRQIRRLIANPRARVAVAEAVEGGRSVVVGWSVSLIRQHVRWRSGRVYSVAVAPEHAGRGIGRALLNWSLAILAAEDIRRVYLEVRETNAPAIRLYREAGFQPVARLASYYGPGADGLRMSRIAPGTTG